ncbi:MAG: inositol monophosphatase family protein [Candidatus Woesearchaeota archaeon]
MEYEAFIKEVFELVTQNIPYPIRDVEEKASKELVTTTDLAVEQLIREEIKKTYPEHGIRGEEEEDYNAASEYQWVIDPIDGTTNYAHNIPVFCVAIALLHDQEVIAAGVHQPITQDVYLATRGRGATKNGALLRVQETPLSEALIGFCHANNQEAVAWITQRYERLKNATRDFRRLGSANLELCMVATGDLAGFVGYEIQPWDFLAGCLIAAEAGCTITNLQGGLWEDKNVRSVLAAPKNLHEELTQHINTS